MQKDPTVSHRAQLITVFLSFWGLLYICLEVSLCFPQPPHTQWGSSDAGKEQSKSLGDVVGFRTSIHFGYECNLSRISPGLASPLSFHVEVHVVFLYKLQYLKCKTYRKSLNYTTHVQLFHPSNNGNVSLIKSFDVLRHPLAI